MKKILSSRMGQVLLCTLIVFACLAGLTYLASNMILENKSILEYIAKKNAKEEADANATIVEASDDLEHAAETKEKQVYQEKKFKQDVLLGELKSLVIGVLI